MSDNVVSWGDREVVLTEDLAPIIKRWLDRQFLAHERQGLKDAPLYTSYDHKKGAPTTKGGLFFTPLNFISNEAKCPQRRIWAILNGESQTVDIGLADRILGAIDHHISEVEVYTRKAIHQILVEQRELTKTVARANGLPPHNNRHLYLQRCKILRKQAVS